MFEHNMYHGSNKENFDLVLAQCNALLEDEPDFIANMANLSSLLYHFLTEVNWVGFYLNRNNELVLGPFMGKSACTRIPFGKGVCGTCAQTLQIQIIDDVHQFPGHIACDSQSNSEIVLPIMVNDQLIGVLDIDSYVFNRFDEEYAIFFQKIIQILTKSSTIAY